MTQGNVEVLIAGGGATGLTLAIDLARRGVRFRLIDKAAGPFVGSRGKGIQPRTQEIFEDLGILDRIVARGGTYPPQWKYRPDGSYVEMRMAETPNPTPAEPYLIPLMIPQFATEAVMRERLAQLGHEVEYAHELRAFEQDEEGATAIVHGPDGDERIRARYLVGADGGHSTIRHALDIGFPGKTLGVRAIVADVSLKGLSRDAWHLFNTEAKERHVSLCPLAGTAMFQLMAAIPPEREPDLSAAALQRLVAARTGVDAIRIESVAWASAYSMNARLAERYRVGRVFIAGDAAHVHPPTGAQGLNTGIQDAYNLGWKLAAVLRGADAALLDTYEEERRPIAEGVLNLSSRLLDAAKRGEIRRGREVYQLDLGYRGSPLALQAADHGDIRIRAGDRAPDVPLRGAAGQPRRLFELLEGPHWTLFEYEPRDGGIPVRSGVRVHSIGANADLHDEHGLFRSTYGLNSGDRVLVRPDGYVGAIVTARDRASLAGYLRRWV